MYLLFDCHWLIGCIRCKHASNQIFAHCLLDELSTVAHCSQSDVVGLPTREAELHPKGVEKL